MTRALCAACLRAQTSCICHWVAPTAHTVEVLILQHPMEVDNAKGTARLLHLSLAHSRLEIGEVFDEHALHTSLTAPWGSDASPNAAATATPKRAVLLYPESPAGSAPGTTKPLALNTERNSTGNSAPHSAQSTSLNPAVLQSPAQLRLVVLDGTWRKSRKMLHLNPLLQELPRLSLQNMPASRYRIRKAHQADQLSTLEATCAALAQLELSAAPFVPLLAALDGFVAQRMAYLPR